MEKKVVSFEIDGNKFVHIQLFIADKISKMLDNVEEYRAKGAHSLANQLLSEIDEWSEIGEQLDNIYDELFSD